MLVIQVCISWFLCKIMHVAMCILCTGYVCVWGGGGEKERTRERERERDLWEPNYCISMGMSVYCLD